MLSASLFIWEILLALSFRKLTFIISVKVTSHPPRPAFLEEVPLLDWQEAGLTKPSTARCSHVARLPKGFFRYGRLSDRDAKAVDAALFGLGFLTTSRRHQ